MKRQHHKFRFEELDIYWHAMDFASEIYELTRLFPRSEVFGLTSQLRRAATSIPANIAEGSSRGRKEFGHFLDIALGSVYESVCLLALSLSQKYISEIAFDQCRDKLHMIAAKLHALKKSLCLRVG